jgi:hypothetical protein
MNRERNIGDIEILIRLHVVYVYFEQFTGEHSALQLRVSGLDAVVIPMQGSQRSQMICFMPYIKQ